MDGDVDTERDIAALVEAGVLVKVGVTVEEAVIDTDEDDTPPPGWHICDCSPDCGAWEPDDEVVYDGFGNEWHQCKVCHNLVVVRPGKVQCDCEFVEVDDE
jgi:hypothetical protein